VQHPGGTGLGSRDIKKARGSASTCGDSHGRRRRDQGVRGEVPALAGITYCGAHQLLPLNLRLPLKTEQYTEKLSGGGRFSQYLVAVSTFALRFLFLDSVSPGTE
jgi:hypothetical protein